MSVVCQSKQHEQDQTRSLRTTLEPAPDTMGTQKPETKEKCEHGMVCRLIAYDNRIRGITRLEYVTTYRTLTGKQYIARYKR